MTAVEWLEQEIKAEVTRFLDGEIDRRLLIAFISIAKEQAKEMEKQNICHFGAKCCFMITKKISWKIEELYNETFNK